MFTIVHQDEDLIQFHKSGALIEGHFVLTSNGREVHADSTFDLTSVYSKDAYMDKWLTPVASKMRDKGINALLISTRGGWDIASRLHDMAVMPPGKFPLLGATIPGVDGPDISPRLRELMYGRHVSIVTDIIAGGEGILRMVQLTREAGAIPVMIAALGNTTNLTEIPCKTGNIPVVVRFGKESFDKITVNTYDPKSCPLCMEEIPFS